MKTMPGQPYRVILANGECYCKSEDFGNARNAYLDCCEANVACLFVVVVEEHRKEELCKPSK